MASLAYAVLFKRRAGRSDKHNVLIFLMFFLWRRKAPHLAGSFLIKKQAKDFECTKGGQAFSVITRVSMVCGCGAFE